MKEYIFNDCKVCINPDIECEYNDRNKLMYEMLLAQHEGMWYLGYHFNMHCDNCNYGCGCGASTHQNKYNPSFDSRGDCIRYGLNKLIGTCKMLISPKETRCDEEGRIIEIEPEYNKVLNKCIQWANAQLGPQQLTFNF